MASDVTDILDDLQALAEDESDVSLQDVVERIGPRGKGALLMVPGLLGASPLGAIPGVPTELLEPLRAATMPYLNSHADSLDTQEGDRFRKVVQSLSDYYKAGQTYFALRDVPYARD